ncbi:Na+/H+ antiporter NhaC family protein [Tautonia plasticadhaerens]|uniref:Na+/H+ antiporter family protein n=1 Tax=Tautonia plasticadhaerens TaxID=2527974 RepID=A0A518H3Q4_9BACT|nr:Na+/H+ antiporter NhaC family protein [Tautonia plasticadhaerens]QDV35469.1 Na+/H+ antiporter family protein [Tautonia plasticadhaerens]
MHTPTPIDPARRAGPASRLLAPAFCLTVLLLAAPEAEARQAPDVVGRRLDRFFEALDRDDDGLVAVEADAVPEAAWDRIAAGGVDVGDGSVDRDAFGEALGDRVRWFGPASLIPAVVALGLAFWTRDVLLSLFAGIVSGAVVKFAQAKLATGLWVPKELDFIGDFFLRALGTESYATILLVYLWFLGGILGVWGKTGAAKHFAEVVGSKVVRGPNTARFFAWLVGMVFHQGGTVSTVLAGSTVRPVSDRNRISHEELSYLVDSTASPAATVLPFNAWPAYVGGLAAGATAAGIGNYVLVPDIDAGISWFFRSVPFNFYGILAVASTFLFSFGLLPWYGGKMKRAIDRARETGQLDAHGARPLVDLEAMEGTPEPGYPVGLVDFLVPLGLLLSLAIVPLAFFQANMINHAFLASTAAAILIAVLKGMPVKSAMDGFLDGCKSMTVGAIILGLAVTLGQVSKDLDTAGFVVSIFGDRLPAALLPAILMLSCMIIAFSIGSSWGTYAVIFPIAVPLALSLAATRLGIDPTTIDQVAAEGGASWSSILFFVQVCFGAVIGGAVFGDQCSPISDTTVLSSMFTGCDLMDHVTTQAPISLVVAGLGALISTALVLIF